MKLLLYYLIAINLTAFLAYGIDKLKAVKNKWRIRESILLGLAFISGSFGALLGMLIFHHKTRKPRFKIGVPLMLIAHIVLFIYLFNYIN